VTVGNPHQRVPILELFRNMVWILRYCRTGPTFPTMVWCHRVSYRRYNIQQPIDCDTLVWMVYSNPHIYIYITLAPVTVAPHIIVICDFSMIPSWLWSRPTPPTPHRRHDTTTTTTTATTSIPPKHRSRSTTTTNTNGTIHIRHSHHNNNTNHNNNHDPPQPFRTRPNQPSPVLHHKTTTTLGRLPVRYHQPHYPKSRIRDFIHRLIPHSNFLFGCIVGSIVMTTIGVGLLLPVLLLQLPPQ
jgi:hypothetical protein